MRQVHIILGFIIFLSLTSCSTHDPQQMHPDFFRDEEGGITSQLLSDRVLSLAVDSRYLWVGTDRGLSRYNKAQGRWDNFTVKDGLAHNHVLSIALDDLQVWIGTRDGVSRYAMDTNMWTRYMPRDGLAGREISCIAVDSRFIWFGTPNGLSRYDKETNSWARKQEADGLAGDAVTQIVIDDDYIWVGTKNGVSRYDKLTDSWNNYDKDSGLIDNSVTAIAAGEDSVWFGTENKGLSRYDQRNSEFVRAYTKRDRLTSDQINTLAVDGTSLWLGTADSGAQRYILSVNTWREHTAETGLPSNHVTAIAADGNVIWFGTYEHGLVRYDLRRERWRFYGEIKALSDNDVKDILATDESVWVATRSGLNQATYLEGPEFSTELDWRTLSKANGLVDNYITALAEVEENLWVGTPRGLGERQGGEDRWTFFTTKDGLLHNFVTCIALEFENRGTENTFSRLWIGTRAGFSTYEPRNQRWNTHPSELQISGWINDIKLDNDFVWIATADGLVYHNLSTGVSGKLTEKDGLPSEMINTVAIGRDSIWIGTVSGLARLDKSFITPHVPIHRGSTSRSEDSDAIGTSGISRFTFHNNVRAIVVDDDTIWIGTPLGLAKYDTAKDLWTHYTREDTNGGLASDNVKTISKNSEKIWIGTTAGVSCLDERTGKWSKHVAATTTEVLRSNWVSKLAEDGERLWFGNWKDSTEGAIVRYNRQTDTFRFFSKEDLPLKSIERPITRIHGLTVGENEVWVGTNGGLLRYNKATDMWRHYTTETGLPNNEVWAIVLDPPYLWAAHIGGVVSRYSLETDTWKPYEIVPSVEWSNIGTIAVDSRYVWVTTVWEGIKRYDKLADRWSSITEAHGLGNNETNDLLIDGDYVWVTGWGDASRYNWRTKEWEIFSSRRVLSGVNFGLDRGLDGVWLTYSGWGGDGAIASKYHNKADSWTTLKLPQMEGVEFDRTKQVVETADAVWFAADEQGLARYNKAAKDWTFFSDENGLASNDLIEYSLVVDDSHAWVGTAGGLSRYDQKKEVWTTFTRSPLTRTLRESKVYAIAAEARYVWLATTNGLHRYDKQTDRWFAPRLKGIEDMEDDTLSITSLTIDEKYAWLGTNNGVLRYDKAGDRWERYTVENGLPSNTIRDLDVRGYDLWISTDRGVATFNRLSDDPNAWESHTQALEVKGMSDDQKYAQTLLSDDVRCVAVGKEMVWFGTDKGTCRYDRQKKTWEALAVNVSVLNKIGPGSAEHPENREIQSNLTDTSVIVIDEEDIWFGTGKGATKYNVESGDFVTYTRSDGLASDVVTCIALNGDEIWFGSADAGATRLNKITGDWRVFNTDDGLLHNRVEAIAFDGDHLWFGTERGLCRYNQKTETWTSYAED